MPLARSTSMSHREVIQAQGHAGSKNISTDGEPLWGACGWVVCGWVVCFVSLTPPSCQHPPRPRGTV